MEKNIKKIDDKNLLMKGNIFSEQNIFRFISVFVIYLVVVMPINIPVVSADSTTPPPLVTILDSKALGPTSVYINWTEFDMVDVPDFDHFNVYRDFALITPTGITDSEFIDTGLNTDFLYRYEISAVDTFGNEGALVQVNIKTLEPNTSTPGVFDLSVTPSSGNVLFNFGTTRQTNSTIYYGLTSWDEETYLETNYVTEHSFQITGLDTNKYYYYRMKNCDEFGVCYFSDIGMFSAGEDTTAPVLDIDFPLLVSDRFLTVSGKTDPYASIIVSTDDNYKFTILADSIGDFTLEDVLLNIDGETKVTLDITDLGGNEASFENFVSVDMNPPFLSIDDISERTTENSLTINGEVDEVVELKIYLSLNEKDTVAPEKITGLSVELSGNNPVLEWDSAPEDDLRGYYVYRDDELIAETVSPRFTDMLADGSTTYSYRVAGIDDVCNIGELSDTDSVLTPDNGNVFSETMDVEDCEVKPYATEKSIPAGNFQKTIKLLDGLNIIDFIVTDKAGNTAKITKNILYDNDKPEFVEDNIGEYAPASYIRDIVIDGKMSEPCSLLIILNEGKNGGALVGGDFEKNYTLSTSEEPDEDGNYYFAQSVMLSRVWSTSGSGTDVDLSTGGTSWENTIKIIATDKAGLQSTLEKSVTYKFCDSSNSDWDVDIGLSMPTEIVPRLLLDGMASFGFTFELEYLGSWDGEKEHPDVTDVQVGFQPLNKFDIDKFDVDWVRDGYPIVNFNPNGENTQGFVNILFNSVKSDFAEDANTPYIEMEKNLAKNHKGECIGVDRTLGISHGNFDITGIGCVKLPLVMTITYGEGKTQNHCIDTSIMITPPVDVASWIPDKFLNDSISVIDDILDFIDKTKPVIEDATEIATYTCLGTWALWFLTEANKLIACRGIDLESYTFDKDGKLDPDDQSAGEGIKGDPQQCFDAVKGSESVWAFQRQVCDRVMCPSVPSFNKYVLDNQENSDSSCKGYSQFFPKQSYAEEVDKEKTKFDAKTKTLLQTKNNGGIDSTDYCEEEYLYEWSSGCWLDNPYKKSFCKYAQNTESGNYKARYETECGFGFEAFSLLDNLKGCEYQSLDEVAWEAKSDRWSVQPPSENSNIDTATLDKYTDLLKKLRNVETHCSNLDDDNEKKLSCYVSDYSSLDEADKSFSEVKSLMDRVKICDSKDIERSNSELARCYDNELKTTITAVDNKIKDLRNRDDSAEYYFWVKRLQDRPSTVVLAKIKSEIKVQDSYLTNPKENLQEVESLSLSSCTECQNLDGENCCDILMDKKVCTYVSQNYGTFDLRSTEIQEMCNGASVDDIIINPTSGIIQSLKCVCLSSMSSYMTQYYSFLSLIKNCFESILYTGEGSGGVCQQSLSMYLCDIIYEAISCLKDYATVSYGTGANPDGNIFTLIGKAGDDVSQGVQSRYGNSNMFKALFDDKALVNSMCMFFFTGNWPLDIADIVSQNTIAVDPIIGGMGERRFQSYDTATGRASFLYTVSPMIVSGAQDFKYNIDLVCSADDSCDFGPCDCMNLGQEQTMRITNKFGNGRLTSGETIDAMQYILVSSVDDPINHGKFRYDKLRISWEYENNAGDKIKDSADYKINELGAPAPAECEFDFRSLEFRCDIFVDETGETYFSTEPSAKVDNFYLGETIRLNEYSIVKRSPDIDNPLTKWLKITVKNGLTGEAINWNDGKNNEKYIPITAEGYNDLKDPQFRLEENLVTKSSSGTLRTCDAKTGAGLNMELVSTADCPVSTMMVFPIISTKDDLNYKSNNPEGDLAEFDKNGIDGYDKSSEFAYRNIYYISGTLSTNRFIPTSSSAKPCKWVKDETENGQDRVVIFNCDGAEVRFTEYSDITLSSKQKENVMNLFTKNDVNKIYPKILVKTIIEVNSGSDVFDELRDKFPYKIVENQQSSVGSNAAPIEMRCPDYLDVKLELFHSSEYSDSEPSDNIVYYNGVAQVKNVKVNIKCEDAPTSESGETSAELCIDGVTNSQSEPCLCGMQTCSYDQKCCLRENSEQLYGTGYCFTPSTDYSSCDTQSPYFDKNQKVAFEFDGDNLIITVNAIDIAEAGQKISPQLFGDVAFFDGTDNGCSNFIDSEGRAITTKRNLNFISRLSGTVLRDYVATTSAVLERGKTYAIEINLYDKAGNTFFEDKSPYVAIQVSNTGEKKIFVEESGKQYYDFGSHSYEIIEKTDKNECPLPDIYRIADQSSFSSEDFYENP